MTDLDDTHDQPNLLSLPAEILEQIWTCDVLDYQDICRLELTSIKLHDVCNSNEVWKRKLDKRWPGLLVKYNRNDRCIWKDEFKRRQEVGWTVHRKISCMSARFFHKEEVPKDGFADLGDTAEPKILRYIIDTLMEIFHDGDSNNNLTEKYYAEKALRYVQQLHLQGEWRRFLEQPSEEQILEKGAVLLAQWCQPTLNITETVISDQLDDLAKLVISELGVKCPEHPAVKRGSEFSIKELSESVWTPRQCRQVLESMNIVFYSKLGLLGNEDDYYDPRNSYINEVLKRKKGIPITLAVVYTSVARRLGVLCYPVNFPAHFLLKWLEHPHLNDGQEYTYVDVFNKGRFMSEYECCNLLDIHVPDAVAQANYEAIGAIKVFERMARNLVGIGRQQGQMGSGLQCLRNAVELLLTICPDEMDARILLARLYLHLNINLQEVMDILQGLSAVDRNAPTGLIGYLMMTAGQHLAQQQREPEVQEIVPKKRSDSPDVEFSIGLIMRHKRYNYTCVIYGWDPECEARQEWILQMGVHNLPKSQYQPFYNVLVEDGSNRYAAEENLELAPEPKVITHPEVGKYFDQFRGTHYHPNGEKLTKYPEDLEVTLRYVQEKYG